MLQFPDRKGMENDEIQYQRLKRMCTGICDVWTELFDHFKWIMLNRWSRSWGLSLNRIDHDHPIDPQPVKEDEQLRPVCAYRVLRVAFLLCEGANVPAMSTCPGCLTVEGMKGHRALTG